MNMSHRRWHLMVLWAPVVVVLGCSAMKHPPGGDGPGLGPDGGAGCQGLSCAIADCTGQPSDTIVQGQVLAPNGVDPIRQATIYVPQSGTVTPFPGKVACEVCANPIGGPPAAQTLSGIDGKFELRGVPVSDSTPIVIQKGRFRKVVKLPITSCQRHQLTVDQGRLPASRGEGDLPQMAVAVGDFDSIECVLQNIGLAGTEFTAPTGAGAVHLYDNETAGVGAPGHVNISKLVLSLDTMLKYNLIFLNCSSTLYSQDLLTGAQMQQVKQNLTSYVAQGGRLYTTDWSYDWIEQPSAFSPFICYNDDKTCDVTTPHGFATATELGRGGTAQSFNAQVSATTQAAQDLSQWLGALPTPVPGNMVPITDLRDEWVLIQSTAVNTGAYPTTTWLTGAVKNLTRPLTVSFDYPVTQQACGKVLYSSYHTRGHLMPVQFPNYCQTGGMIPQEHVLEFLIFEISACLGPVLG